MFGAFRVFAVLVAVCVLCGAAMAAEIAVVDGVVYGQGYVATQLGGKPELRDLLCDVYKPAEGKSLRTAVVLIHGGSFMNGDRKQGGLVRIAKFLAENGYTCVSIDYRMAGDFPPAPAPYDATILQAAIHAAFVDAKTAVRFVRGNAAAYGVDPQRIAILGESAGGFAAIAAGVSNADDFTSDGPDFPLPAANNPGVAATVSAVIELWGSPEPVSDKFDAADPPILITHGTKDTHVAVPYVIAEKLKFLCEQNGVPHEFYPLEGKKHGAWDGECNGKPLNDIILDFLTRRIPAAGG